VQRINWTLNVPKFTTSAEQQLPYYHKIYTIKTKTLTGRQLCIPSSKMTLMLFYFASRYMHYFYKFRRSSTGQQMLSWLSDN